MTRPLYLVRWIKHNGIQRTHVADDLMGAVTLCEWLDEQRVSYKCEWVDENGIRHETCEAISDKLDEARREERHLREASCPSWALPHSSHCGWQT